MASPESGSLSDKKIVTEYQETSDVSEKGNDGIISNDGPAPFDEKATIRLLRKMDFYLIPFLALLYL